MFMYSYIYMYIHIYTYIHVHAHLYRPWAYWRSACKKLRNQASSSNTRSSLPASLHSDWAEIDYIYVNNIWVKYCESKLLLGTRLFCEALLVARVCVSESQAQHNNVRPHHKYAPSLQSACRWIYSWHIFLSPWYPWHMIHQGNQ